MAEFNEKWFYWQEAWKGGQAEPVLSEEDLTPEMLTALMDAEYLEKDWARGEGEVDMRYQLRNNFTTKEQGHFVIRFILEKYKQIRQGFYG
ncbi:hypothetical protein D3C78_1711220 [compost metagenome]